MTMQSGRARAAGTALVPIACALSGLVMAAPASADQYDYVLFLDSKGVYYSSASDVIDQGKMACRLLRTGAGVPAALKFLGGAGYADYEAAAIVVAAAADMCQDAMPIVHSFAFPDGAGSTKRSA